VKTRYLLIGLLTSPLMAGAAGVATADPIQIGVSTNPNSYGVAEIQVDGPTADGVYTEIRNETLDYIMSVRGDRPKKADRDGDLEIQFKKTSPLENDGLQTAVFVHGKVTESWKNYKVSVPYVDPWSRTIANERISPIEVCNENLASRKKDNRREAMLKKGLSFEYADAYKVRGYVRYPGDRDYWDVIAVPVKITCMPLDRPRVRTQAGTTGVDPKPGQKMKPTISEVALRIEPAQIEQMGKFLCPQQLKLHGRLETIREFTGKSIFVGPYYLSPITEIAMTKAGNRNMTGTYKIDWDKMGGLTTGAGTEPKKQLLTFKFNVSNKDGKVLDSAEKSIEVSCKKIRANAPTAGDGMTVAPVN
jgi:hypothetical protein